MWVSQTAYNTDFIVVKGNKWKYQQINNFMQQIQIAFKINLTVVYGTTAVRQIRWCRRWSIPQS